ncbi:MAG: MBL fold metallo-hydrolase [Dehalococcoidia bacterium]|nr:MBL fold metallo-hydrolase [Dehalococcoidia bacterium]
MEITWLGHSCFRLKGKEASVITDPYADTLGRSLGKIEATLVTVSNDHPHHNNVAAVAGAVRTIRGPGEYEVAHVLVMGIPTYHDAVKGKDLGKNIVYLIEMDDVRVCHLGDLGHTLSSKEIADLGAIDVLLVPVGGVCTINASTAAEVIGALEPKLVVPMHYPTTDTKVNLEPLERFLKAMGLANVQPLARLSVTASNVPQQTQVVVLEPVR